MTSAALPARPPQPTASPAQPSICFTPRKTNASLPAQLAPMRSTLIAWRAIPIVRVAQTLLLIAPPVWQVNLYKKTLAHLFAGLFVTLGIS